MPQVTVNIPEKNKEALSSSESEENCENVPKSWTRGKYTGLCLTLLSGLLFTSTGLIVKYLKGYHVLTLGFYRFSGMLIPSIPILIYAALTSKREDETSLHPVFQSIWPLSEREKLKTWAVLIGRGVLGFFAISFHFMAIQRIPLSDATVIGSCNTVFVTVMAFVFLRERAGFFPLLTACLTILGVGIIARPPLITGAESYDLNTLLGTVFALSRMVCTSVVIIFVRFLRGVHAALLLVIVGAVMLFLNLCAIYALDISLLPKESWHWGLLFAVGTLSFISQMVLTLALKCEQAGAFAVVRTSSETIFAFLLQLLFLSFVPDTFSIIGTIVIITAIFLTMARKWLASLPNDNHYKKKYSFVLK